MTYCFSNKNICVMKRTSDAGDLRQGRAERNYRNAQSKDYQAESKPIVVIGRKRDFKPKFRINYRVLMKQMKADKLPISRVEKVM